MITSAEQSHARKIISRATLNHVDLVLDSIKSFGRCASCQGGEINSTFLSDVIMALARDSINKITTLFSWLIDTVNFFHCTDTSLKVKIFNAVSAVVTMQYRFFFGTTGS